MSNIIQYTSRDYDSILNDINSVAELRDKPDWFKRLISGSHDVLSRYIDAQANQSYLSTAFTRARVAQLLQLIDYNMRGKVTSTGIQRFNIKATASFPYSISKDDLAAISQASINITALKFEAREDATFTPSAETFTASAGTDILTVAAEYHTGDLVRLTTSNTLPGGLALVTDYFVISISATEIKLSDDYDSAMLGEGVVDITSTGTGTHTITSYALKVDVWQQETVSELTIGKSDGITEWQEFVLQNLNVLKETVLISVAEEDYELVDTFVYSEAVDEDFRFFYNTDMSSKVRFGNGTYGKIPPNSDVIATYAFGGGTISNISVIDRINLYAGADLNVSNTSNVTTMTGGDDEESIESAKILGPELLRTFNNFVKTQDGIALVKALGGISRVHINANKFGLLTCEVVIVPNGGGTTTTQFKEDIEDYLEERTILESVEVTCIDAVYVTEAVTSNFSAKTGFTFNDVKTFYDLAVTLFFSEKTLEITNDYTMNGLASAVTLINQYFATAFSSASYAKIKKLLDGYEVIDFGARIDENDLIAYVKSFVDGVDDMVIVSPAFPIELEDNEITTIGTITTTETP